MSIQQMFHNGDENFGPIFCDMLDHLVEYRIVQVDVDLILDSLTKELEDLKDMIMSKMFLLEELLNLNEY